MAHHRTDAVRAPSPDTFAWVAHLGWVDLDTARQALEAGDDVLVAEGGHLRALVDEPAPLIGLLRLDADVAQLVDRIAALER